MSIAEYKQLLAKHNSGKAAASEHDLQVQCVRWFRYVCPQYKELLFAIPNGGQRNAVVAAKLKAEGVQAGVPDLFLAVPKKGYHGLWIEMKNGKAGRVSEHQKEMIEILLNQGYKCAVCYNFEEFKSVVEWYMI